MTSENAHGQRLDNVRYPIDLSDAATKRYANAPRPTGFAYAASVALDAIDNVFFQQTDTLTGDIAFVLNNLQPGCSGVIAVVQDGTGGRKITGFTTTGFTQLMRDDLTTLNTTAMKVAGARSWVAYDCKTLNGVPVIIFSIISGVAAAFT